MARWRITGVLAGLALIAACGESARDNAPPPDTVVSPVGSAQALSGDRFVLPLEGTRQEVRLAGVAAPRREPSAALAREALQNLLDEAGSGLVLEPAGPGRNRHGTLIAEAISPAGRLQDQLISQGWVMVDSHGDHTGPTPDRLQREERARNAGLGAWAHHDLRVHTPDPNALAPFLDSVQIVEGRVISTGSARDGRIYLNFGTDWRTDFTVQVRRRDQRRFEAAGMDLSGLEGAVVRVRGWLYEENGPIITLDHAEALEIVDAPQAAPLPGRP